MINKNENKNTKPNANAVVETNFVRPQTSRGITLVALIITIIVMLILVGVTINVALNGGLFDVTKRAVRETEIATYKEKIDAEGINIIVEQISKGLSSKEFIDRYEEELRKNKDFEGSVITRKDDGTILLTTKEGYEFEITEEGTKYTRATEAPKVEKPTNLNKSNTGFEYNIKEWTNKKVKVKIKVTEEIKGTLQYSRDGKTWTKYEEEEIEISNNNTSIYARVINIEEEVGTVWTGNIENIDRLAPTVSVVPNGGSYVMPSTGNAKISTEVTAEDAEKTNIDGQSGLEILQYVWNTSNTEEPTEGWTEFTNGGRISKEDITEAGTWYLWTKVIDKAGNRAENIKVSNAFIVGGANQEANTITLTPNPSTPTNGNVEVTVSYGANLTGNKTLECEGTEGTDYTVDGVASVTVKTNGKMVTAMAEDAEGNEVVATHTVKNIDKTEPEISLSQTDTTTKEYQKTISVNATDNESGIAIIKYALGNKDKSYFASNGKAVTNGEFTAQTADYPTLLYQDLSKDMVYTVYAKNNAGIESVKTITISNLLIDYVLTGNNGLYCNSISSKDENGTIKISRSGGSGGIWAISGPECRLPEGNFQVTFFGTGLSDADFKTDSIATRSGRMS